MNEISPNGMLRKEKVNPLHLMKSPREHCNLAREWMTKMMQFRSHLLQHSFLVCYFPLHVKADDYEWKWKLCVTYDTRRVLKCRCTAYFIYLAQSVRYTAWMGCISAINELMWSTPWRHYGALRRTYMVHYTLYLYYVISIWCLCLFWLN